MFRELKKLFLLLAAITTSQVAFAQTAEDQKLLDETYRNSPIATPTPAYNSATYGTGTSSSSGNKGQIIMIASAGAAVATATVLKTPCVNAFSSAWACPLMALALGQVVSSLGGAKDAGKSSGALADSGLYGSGTGADGSPLKPTNLGSAYGDGSVDLNGGGSGSSSLANSQIASLTKTANALANDLKKSGASLSADGQTVTMPNGKKVSASTFGSAGAMKAAGFTDSQISAMQDTMNQASKAADAKYKAIAALTNDVGGAGGGRGSGGGEETGSNGGGYGGSGFDDPYAKRGGKEGSAGIAGMSKKLGDDNIGVAGDNLFEMVTRRYQARDKADNFLKDR